ncbi:hypothetical protein BIV24_19305 [Streptomyces colonosanans]|uniref:Uncharacterized protein n=1 Tax=Streptomyces colonosanans TaxID=1428652 RepID=A0A1S2P7V3_9ACTN|nr:hypothetical protein [Streptomyces colonosanans]OIJ89768.1 hypothetical protein BIV24_19305 [Streptomyces colonosanans]
MTLTFPAITCLLFVTLGYVTVCASSPFGTCRRCRGFGFQFKQDRKGRLKRGRPCRRCDGHGKRIRVGRRLFNRVQRIHREGSR